MVVPGGIELVAGVAAVWLISALSGLLSVAKQVGLVARQAVMGVLLPQPRTPAAVELLLVGEALLVGGKLSLHVVVVLPVVGRQMPVAEQLTPGVKKTWVGAVVSRVPVAGQFPLEAQEPVVGISACIAGWKLSYLVEKLTPGFGQVLVGSELALVGAKFPLGGAQVPLVGATSSLVIGAQVPLVGA